jgi:poly(3-hydroxybutyrate) depolymerase
MSAVGSVGPLAAQSAEILPLEVGEVTRAALLVNGGADRGLRPAVIVLHGGGGSAEAIRQASGFDGVAVDHDFVVVYGQGTEYADDRRAWNHGFLNREAVLAADDIAYLDALIDELIAGHEVDPQRVFLAGVSNGGMMALRYAVARADRLAGVASAAGAMFTLVDAPSRPVPILLIHGALDQEVPPEGGWSGTGLVRVTQLAPYQPLTDTVNFWVESNRSEFEPTLEEEGSLVTTLHGPRVEGTMTKLLWDSSGGHGWPGRPSPRPENPALAPGVQGAEYMWKFFSEQTAVVVGKEKTRLHLRRDVEGGLPRPDWLLSWRGRAQWQSTLQISSDLRDWKFWPRFVDGGGETVTWNIPDDGSRSFFRLVETPMSDEPWLTQAALTDLAEYRILGSAAAGRPVSFHLYLPSAYHAEPERRFPVLYWLHGSGPGVLGVPPLANYFHAAMEAGVIPPMIVVFPNGLPDGMWCDSKDGQTPMESIVMDDLIPFVDATLRSLATREGRIIEGFSMGGYGAGRLGLKYPDHFRAFSMIGAGPLQLDLLEDNPDLRPIEARERIFAKVFGGDLGYFEAQSPWRLAEEAQAMDRLEGIRIRQLVGSDDFVLEANQALHQHLLSLGIGHEYREIAGVGHNVLAVLQALGGENWAFYRDEFGP